MEFAPRHDWSFYEARSKEIDAEWERSLTPSQKFDLYESYFTALVDAQRSLADSERMEAIRWEEKLTLRMRMLRAFRALDEWRSGKTASNNAR